MTKINKDITIKKTLNSGIIPEPMMKVRLFFIILLSTILLIGCQSDDNSTPVSQLDPNELITDTVDNNFDSVEKQTDAFAENLHPVLSNRCGACHSGKDDEPEGTPDFAHQDVATAYSVITTDSLVNLSSADESRLVQKVLSVHKCVQPACDAWAGEVQAGIESWAMKAPMTTTPNSQDPTTENPSTENPTTENPGTENPDTGTNTPTLDAQTTAFANNLHSILISNCGSCHAGLDDEPEDTPDFAHQDVTTAFSVIDSNSLVNLQNSNNSRLVQKVLSMHMCSQPTCDTWATSIQVAINAWADEVSVPDMTENPGTNPVTLDAPAMAFADNLHSVLVDTCGSCHAGREDEPAGTPDFAHQDIATAYSVVMSNTLANLGNPTNSRLIQKVLSLHKCTQPTCGTWADNIQAGIEGWATALAGTETGAGITGSSIVSTMMTLADGIKDEGAGRIEDAIIAKYDFKTGTGATAFDTSNVLPAIDLTLSENVNWIAGRGIEITDPNAAEITIATGTADASKKLFDKIAGPEGTKQYSIEAWLINDNTALDGPARIVTYSKDAQNRNFTMGQVTSYYSFRNRSDKTGNNGSAPALETDNNAGDLKPQLQHIVFTFDSENGRNIYVDGRKADYDNNATDPSVPADIANWDATYQFALGNEISNNVKRQWLGKLLFVGIHNRALTADEILQNTLEGIGDKFILEFDISQMVDTSGNTNSKISMVVSELDAFSYVFGTPTLITDIPVPNIPVKNIRIAVNDNIPAAAQAFRNVDMTVTANDTELSPLGAVIPKDTGPETDMFALVFEILGNNSNVVVEQNPTPIADMTVNEPSPEYGIRTFAQINNTMAVLTGVDASATKETYVDLEQQLPGTANLEAFVSANQIGIAKLSLEYCDAMVESNTLRSNFFGDTFEFTSPVVTALSDQAKRDIIINNLVDKMIGTNLSTQPTLAEIQPEINQLMDELSANCNVADDCDAARTRTIVKAACASVLASAAVSID